MADFSDRLMLSAVRKSSWLLNSTRFSVTKRQAATPIIVPIVGGRGLNLLDPVDADLAVSLRTVLEFRPGPVIDIGANVGLFLMALLELDRDIPYCRISSLRTA